jgi:ribosomal protein L11 methylase PrmA
MLLAGTGRVTATDLDREILPNILDNFQLNGLLAEQAPLETLQDQFRLHIGPLTNSVVGPGLNTEFQPPWSGPFDLILCNMLQHEFTPLLGNLAELARPGAAMVLSGWLAKDFDEVQADLTAAGWTMIETIREQQEWGGLVVRRS